MSDARNLIEVVRFDGEDTMPIPSDERMAKLGHGRGDRSTRPPLPHPDHPRENRPQQWVDIGWASLAEAGSGVITMPLDSWLCEAKLAATDQRSRPVSYGTARGGAPDMVRIAQRRSLCFASSSL